VRCALRANNVTMTLGQRATTAANLAPRLQVARGPWAPRPQDARFAGALGLLVLDGLVIRTICVQGRDCAELVGAGDLLRPWETAQDGLVEGPCTWRVLEPTTLAILDRQRGRVVRI
jgi:hypothetical protein